MRRRASYRQGTALAVMLGAALAAPAQAQAGAWVLGRNHARFEVKLLHQDTTQRYFLDGERIPFFFDGHSRTSAIFVDAAFGLPASLEVSVQASLFRLDFDDLADSRRSTGPGDTRLGLRWNAVLDPVIVTLSSRVKLPTGRFENDAEIVPVGEGQYDLDLSLEIARSLWPRLGYVTGEIGYRLRAENKENGIDPGDELFWSIEGGWAPFKRVSIKLLVRGLHGAEATTFGLPIATLKRKVVYIEPGLLIGVGGKRTLSVAVPISIGGRNWPAGPVLSVGLAQVF